MKLIFMPIPVTSPNPVSKTEDSREGCPVGNSHIIVKNLTPGNKFTSV